MNIKLFSALLLLTGGLDVMNSAVAGKADLVGTAVVNDMKIEFYMEAPKQGMVMTSGMPMKMSSGSQPYLQSRDDQPHRVVRCRQQGGAPGRGRRLGGRVSRTREAGEVFVQSEPPPVLGGETESTVTAGGRHAV